MTAWAAGLRHNIRKQNRSIIPVFNTLSVLMKFKSPVTGVFGSLEQKRKLLPDNHKKWWIIVMK
ncbi:hypothetical protein EGM21_19365 [Salmonella enterica subsp. enterica serovar Enteritidis]|uniref:Uncharacterized protein n=1 Tax=Salmonella enteritidis TaxID=149539 RepID=A0A5X4H2P8_SALEN|nr:hypothetical protein [Salmonella enterica subsp. enterica serovar Enteritidis]ECC9501759.1 hypothetical protein [Salmonella enterica subsp. enterica]EFD4953049.1 hypothetical protein [Escherichia coli]EFE8014127.1 hypothetical protein [Escherichia coli]MDD9849212.1 hypothetical protein [Escherichia coli]